MQGADLPLVLQWAGAATRQQQGPEAQRTTPDSPAIAGEEKNRSYEVPKG
jgi:hypothetical protein